MNTRREVVVMAIELCALAAGIALIDIIQDYRLAIVATIMLASRFLPKKRRLGMKCLAALLVAVAYITDTETFATFICVAFAFKIEDAALQAKEGNHEK